MLVQPISAQDEIIFRNGRAYRVSGAKPVADPVVEETPPKVEETCCQVPIPPPRITIIRRSSSAWTDPDIGPWSTSTLKKHLRGELESTQHRGMVPSQELDGRSLSELKAIHANLHEGWTWDGRSRQSRRTVTKSTEMPPANTDGPAFYFDAAPNCPNGFCPGNSNRPFLRRFR